LTEPGLLFETELASRSNPEKTRRFDPAKFELNLSRLEKFAKQLSGVIDPSVTDISVVGTNGKGSTAFYLAQMFGKKSGLYTSPHLVSIYERIRLGLSPVDPEMAWQALESLREMVPLDDLSYFELLTLLAGWVFARQNLPVRIYEGGLGGRLDATRIFQAQNVILTSIGLDHTEILGTTPIAILREKLGVITPRAKKLFSMHQRNLDEGTVRTEALRLKPDLEIHFYAKSIHSGESYLGYNREFAAFCFERIAGPEAVRGSTDGIPGRLESHRVGNRTFIFDTAHNPDAITIALESLAGMSDFPGKQDTLVVFGILPDRDEATCLNAIERSGFPFRIQVTGGPFRETKIGEFVSIENVSSLSGRLRPWNVFIGSHRFYQSFLDLLGAMKNL